MEGDHADIAGGINAYALTDDFRPAREELLTELHARRRGLIAALIAILRKKPLDEREESILDRCLMVLEATHNPAGTVPLMDDLRTVLKARPAQVREVALDRGSDERYDTITGAWKAR